jgi:molecular chaperone GrpE (heat shock protein)
MIDREIPKLSKWPFLLGDVLLIAVAGWIILRTAQPLPLWPLVTAAACAAVGAWLFAMPFVLEYRAAVRRLEQQSFASTLAQIRNVEQVAEHISGATARWQDVQEHAARTTAAAKEISERMAAEAKDFCAFLEKANDTEKAHLHLEVEKLRRAEGEWLQLTIRLLDHVYALYLAGVQSGQANVIAQLTQFQSACRDLVRRMGLTPFVVPPDTAFDPNRDQLLDGQTAPSDGARVGETLATGYTYQGKLLRRAVVALLREGETAAHPGSGAPVGATSAAGSPALVAAEPAQAASRG